MKVTEIHVVTYSDDEGSHPFRAFTVYEDAVQSAEILNAGLSSDHDGHYGVSTIDLYSQDD